MQGSAGQASASSAEPSATDREQKASGPATDALNLWVLNRPQGDLPVVAEPSPAAIEAASIHAASATAMVVLGVGAGRECAEQFARRAVDALAASQAPVDVLADALDGARRWRWPSAPGTWSATLASSTGEFGGVHGAPASAFGGPLLRDAMRQRAIRGGPRPRWASAPSLTAPEHYSCSAVLDPSLAGPIGVMLRTGSGTFFGGVLGADPLADAGVVSIAAQYGVSLSIGAAGGVLMIGDCDPPPLERVAERVHASPNWALATAELQTPGDCRLGHALLSSERAWVASNSTVAWAAVEAAPPPVSTPAITREQDAGLTDAAVEP